MRKNKVWSVALSVLLLATVLMTGCDDGLPGASEIVGTTTGLADSSDVATTTTSKGATVTTTTSSVGNTVHDMAAEQGGNLLITDKQDNIAKCAFLSLEKGADGKSKTWSDFVFIDDKMWVFFPSTDNKHGKKDGLIRIYNPETGKLEKSFFHDFGCVSTVDYHKETDRLLIGNSAENTISKATIYIFNDVASWVDAKEGSALLFADKKAAIVDVAGIVREGTTHPTNIAACWGEDAQTVYISGSYNRYWWKIILGTGADELEKGTYDATSSDNYNGSYKVVWSKGFTPVHSVYQEQPYGMLYENGILHTTNGRHEIQWWEWTAEKSGMSRSEHRVAVINADGSLRYSISKGIDIYNGYLYVGCMFSDKGKDTYAENHEVCTGDHGVIKVKLK